MTNPYAITRARAGSTTDLGYRTLESFTGPIPQHVLVPPTVPGQARNFVQGVTDAMAGQSHHQVRDLLMGFVVGAVVGHQVARMRHPW
jgi:hypothetical protein